MNLQEKIKGVVTRNLIMADGTVPQALDNTSSILAEIAERNAIEFADWKDKLQPSEKVSFWSKDGQFKGLMSMDTEQLYAKYKSLILNSKDK